MVQWAVGRNAFHPQFTGKATTQHLPSPQPASDGRREKRHANVRTPATRPPTRSPASMATLPGRLGGTRFWLLLGSRMALWAVLAEIWRAQNESQQSRALEAKLGGFARLHLTTSLHLRARPAGRDGVCALPHQSPGERERSATREAPRAPLHGRGGRSPGRFLVTLPRRGRGAPGVERLRLTKCGTYLGARPASLVPVGESSPSPGLADFSRFICCRIEFNSLITFAFGPDRMGLLTSETSPHNLEVLG